MSKNQKCNRILRESTLRALERQGSELSDVGPTVAQGLRQEPGSLQYHSTPDAVLQPRNQT